MFARERASIRQHKVGGVIHKGPELLHSSGGLEIERDAAMNAAVTKMAEQCIAIVVLFEELVEVTQIVSEPLWRYCGILPGGPGIFNTRDSTGGDAGFPDVPDGLLFGRVCEEAHARIISVAALNTLHGSAGLVARLG
jgi:hypothetical protein